MTTWRRADEFRCRSAARSLRCGIVCALVVAVAGCGPADMDEATELGSKGQEWNSAFNDVHEPMTEEAVDKVHWLLGKSVFDRDVVVWGNDQTDSMARTSARKFHFLRDASKSSRKACEESTLEIIRSVYKALGQRHNSYSFNFEVGVATHILQDSTAPAHARRVRKPWPYYRKLKKVCVGIGEPLPAGSCRHAKLDPGDFDWSHNGRSEEYIAGRRATTGLLRAVANLKKNQTYSWSAVSQAVMQALQNPTDMYTGYVDCRPLSTTDIYRPRPRDECGCLSGQICCEPNVCITPPQGCP